MNTEYSLFLIKESSIDDISNVTRFSNISLNTLITEADGESFIDKIKRLIKFILNKISNFFTNMTSSQDELKNKSGSIINSKTKEIQTALYEKLYNNTFNIDWAFDAFEDARSQISKGIKDPHADSGAIRDKYFKADKSVVDILGERKEFHITLEKAKQIITHTTDEINNFTKIHNKLKDLYANIESKLSDNLSEERKAEINHQVAFLNAIAGDIFNHVKSITKLANSDINRLVTHFNHG